MDSIGLRFRIRESSTGTRVVAGTVSLLLEFESAIRKRIGIYAEHVFSPRYFQRTIRDFREHCMIEFKDDDEILEVHIAGALVDIPEAGVEEGYMSMSRQFIQLTNSFAD